MNKTKRTLSTFIAIVLALSLLPTLLCPVGASAADIIDTEAALRNAVSMNGTGNVILSANIDALLEQLTIARSLTLDLNGHTLPIDLTYSVNQTSSCIRINPGVTLTIIDSAGGGILSAKATDDGVAINTVRGALIIQSGMITAISNHGTAIGNNNDISNNFGGAITISGGTVIALSKEGVGIGGGIRTSNNGVITITGGTVYASSTHGACIGGGYAGNAGTINISGGTIFASGDYGACIGGNSDNGGGEITISGGAIYAKNSYAACIGGGYAGNSGIINISDAKIIASSSHSKCIGAGPGGEDISVEVTGQYDYWVNMENIPPAEKSGSGTFPVENPYRYIMLNPLFDKPTGKMLYEALQAECAATNGNGVVMLTQDIIADDFRTTQLRIARPLKLDLNGHVLSINIYDFREQTSPNGIEINPGVTLTITDSAGGGILNVLNEANTFSGANENKQSAINTSSGALIIQSGTIIARSIWSGAGIGGGINSAGGNISIKGGAVIARGGCYSSAGIGGGDGGASGNINISGGIVISSNGEMKGAASIGGGYYGKSETINISGGIVIASCLINNDGTGGAGIGSGAQCYSNGIVNISGGTVNATGDESAAGIGGGNGSVGGTINISGGTILAKGGDGAAGIGGGHGGSSGTIVIHGGNITAIAGDGPDDQTAIGRGCFGLNSRPTIAGLYDYWVNTTNIAPANKTGTGAFIYSDTYKYIKLTEVASRYKTAVVCRQDSSVKSNSTNTYTVDFLVQTLENKALANLQSIKLSIDMNIFDLVGWDGEAIDLSSLTTSPQRLPDSTFSTLTGWTGSLWALIDGEKLLLLVEPSRGIDPFDHPNGYFFNELTTLLSFRLVYRPGRSIHDVTENTIRLMDEDELLLTNSSEQLLLSDGNDTFTYGGYFGGMPVADTISAPEFIFYNGVTVKGRIKTYNPGNSTTIRLYIDEKVIYETTVGGFGPDEVQEQEFIIGNVQPNTYTLEITKTAHTKYVVHNIHVDEYGLDLTQDPRIGVSLMELLVGDANGDGFINANDINLIWSGMNYSKSVEQARDKTTDLNGDGVVNVNDLNLAWSLKNYSKGAVIID